MPVSADRGMAEAELQAAANGTSPTSQGQLNQIASELTGSQVPQDQTANYIAPMLNSLGYGQGTGYSNTPYGSGGGGGGYYSSGGGGVATQYAPYDVGSGHSQWDELQAQLAQAMAIENQQEAQKAALQAEAEKAAADLQTQDLAATQQAQQNTDVLDWAKMLSALQGPASPYQYLYNSVGLNTPRGYAPTPMAIPQDVLQQMAAQGINPAQAQQFLTGATGTNGANAPWQNLAGLTQNGGVIRSGASGNSTDLGDMAPGTGVTITGPPIIGVSNFGTADDVKGSAMQGSKVWYPVTTSDGKTGYISAWDLQNASSLPQPGQVTQAAPTDANGNPLGTVRAGGAPIRTDAGPQGQLEMAPGGSQITVTGPPVQGQNNFGNAAGGTGSTVWYPVTVNGQQGYISAWDLANANALPQQAVTPQQSQAVSNANHQQLTQPINHQGTGPINAATQNTQTTSRQTGQGLNTQAAQPTQQARQPSQPMASTSGTTANTAQARQPAAPMASTTGVQGNGTTAVTGAPNQGQAPAYAGMFGNLPAEFQPGAYATLPQDISSINPTQGTGVSQFLQGMNSLPSTLSNNLPVGASTPMGTNPVGSTNTTSNTSSNTSTTSGNNAVNNQSNVQTNNQVSNQTSNQNTTNGTPSGNIPALFPPGWSPLPADFNPLKGLGSNFNPLPSDFQTRLQNFIHAVTPVGSQTTSTTPPIPTPGNSNSQSPVPPPTTGNNPVGGGSPSPIFNHGFIPSLLTGGLQGPPAGTPPLDLSKIDPTTRALVNYLGTPITPSQQQWNAMNDSQQKAYLDYASSVAGANPNDLQARMDQLGFSGSGAPVAGGFKS